MPDKLIKIIRALEEGDTKRINSLIVDPLTKRKYNYKSYVISGPLDLIRIDIRRRELND